MKKCKLIKIIPGSTNFLNVNKIYNYHIISNSNDAFNYHIYGDQNNLIGTFSEGYFKTWFLNEQEIRKLKLEHIYEPERRTI